MFNCSKGLPFTVDTLELYKTANTSRNKKLYNKKDYNFLKKIVDDNRDDIIRYWNADPNTREGLRTIESIENGFEMKYIRKK